MAPPATSGYLSAVATIPLGVSSSGPEVAAEAPDGTVFVANPPSADVLVIHGDSAPAVAEHVQGTVSGLAADATSLYVATATAAYQFDRAGGAQTERWSVQGPGSLTIAGGVLWFLAPISGGVNLYSISPGSADPPVLVENALGAVVGPDGTLYYERTDGHLVRQDPSDTISVGPALQTKQGVAGPTFVGLAGGFVWTYVSYYGTNGAYQGYYDTTLRPGPYISGSAGVTMAATLTGVLWKMGNGESRCGTGSCVLRFGSDWSLSDPYPVDPTATLIGPYPALLGPSGGSFELVRLT